MLPPEGWRLEAELYSPASNKTKSRSSCGPTRAGRGPRVWSGRPVLAAPAFFGAPHRGSLRGSRQVAF
jgi:hypothetical protein